MTNRRKPQAEPDLLADRRKAVRAARIAACGGDREVTAVVAMVAASRRITAQKLLDPRRCDSQVATARQLAMYLTHVMLSRSLNEIGRLFGRDRTTVAHACWVMEDRRDDAAFDSEVSDFEETIRNWRGHTDAGEARRAAG